MQFALYGTMTMDANVFMIGFSSNKKKDLGNHVMKDKPFTLQAIRGCHGHGYILFSKMKKKSCQDTKHNGISYNLKQ
jgi:hypothetical protein